MIIYALAKFYIFQQNRFFQTEINIRKIEISSFFTYLF